MKPETTAEPPPATTPTLTPSPKSTTESALSNSGYLTRMELLTRRASRLRRLARCYTDHYWHLMEDLRSKHREFTWKFGVDAFTNNSNINIHNNNNNYGNGNGNGNGNGDDDGGGELGFGSGKGKLKLKLCNFPNCQSKAMALTDYCHAHILLDAKQVLYTKCQFAYKCGEDPILCGKPVLKSTIPCMCCNHIGSTQKIVRQALKKNNVSNPAAKKLASKFHLVLTEYVRLIQVRRRALRIENLTTPDITT